jgi:hypothetical protein
LLGVRLIGDQRVVLELCLVLLEKLECLCSLGVGEVLDPLPVYPEQR